LQNKLTSSLIIYVIYSISGTY